ncbi:hypothetical protein [Vibrio sp. 1CM23M]|uniref:hypothetical protein n=1 Tax=Vibrio sp. 1CM23M TaxID=2929164 RepID=UPI0020C086B6|nr:hypothetical protein [Vibrio sp. 1CM23M]MCK8072448.1 hypothetical protein [Vibrio sp. 1CM23M]
MSNTISKLLAEFQPDMELASEQKRLNVEMNYHKVDTKLNFQQVIQNNNDTNITVKKTSMGLDVRLYEDDILENETKGNVNGVNNLELLALVGEAYFGLDKKYKNDVEDNENYRQLKGFVSDVTKSPKRITLLESKTSGKRFLNTQNYIVELDNPNGVVLHDAFIYANRDSQYFKTTFKKDFHETTFKFENDHKMRLIHDKNIPCKTNSGVGYEMRSLLDIDNYSSLEDDVMGVSNELDIYILNQLENRLDSVLEKGNYKFCRQYSKLRSKSIIDGEVFIKLDNDELELFSDGNPTIDRERTYVAYESQNADKGYLVLNDKIQPLKMKNGKPVNLNCIEFEQSRADVAPPSPDYTPKRKSKVRVGNK